MRVPRIDWIRALIAYAPSLRFVRRRNAAYLRVLTGRFVFWGGAVGVGLLAVAFAKLADWFGHQFQHAGAFLFWLPLVLTPVGGAIVVYLTRRFFPGSEGSGIPQAIASLSRKPESTSRPLLSIRILVGKMVLGATAIGCGFSCGREGPTAQVGASLMNEIHRWLPRALHVRREHLIVAGSAAGVAAAFNTPLAGVIFAIEEMSRSVETRMSGIVITTIVLAGVVARVFLGGGHYYGHVLITASPRDLFTLVVVASLVTGLAGGLFARMLITSALRWTGRLADYRRAHPVRFAAFCGLLVAAIGLVTGGATFGTGYEPTKAALEGHANFSWTFAPFKFAATVLSYLAGLPGGIFAPSLSIGAGLGHSLAPLFAETNAAGDMLMVLCMVGFLAAVTQAPITSFVIVMEMVDGYSQVIALMSVALLASGVSRLLGTPLYHTLAERYHESEPQPAPPEPAVAIEEKTAAAPPPATETRS
jgi:H+/Cl- antiporter ClcA